jgi:MFS family permease
MLSSCRLVSGESANPHATGEETIRGAQHRALVVLVASQILGGLGVSSGIAVGALVAARLLGREELAGLVQSGQVLGAALLALPAASLAVSYGRRVGLGAAYGLAVIGALLCVVSAATGIFVLLLLGSALFGGGSTAGLQARYAATDLASVADRGRAMSTVVWASTIGAVAGPNLIAFGAMVARVVNIPPLAGPYVVAMLALAAAAACVFFLLKPDPLLLARERDSHITQPSRRRGVLRHGIMVASQSAPALLGMVAIVVAHSVMVAVMVMTPIHMDHGQASLTIIGLVISIHILGMYAAAPLVGLIVDRWGRIPVIVTGGGILLAATLLAGRSHPGSSIGLGVGLFLLGLGWSCCLIAGSTLLTDAVAVADRPVVQGASDLLMGLVAAGVGALAGLVMGGPGYAALNAGAAVLVVLLLAATAHPACHDTSNTRSR